MPYLSYFTNNIGWLTKSNVFPRSRKVTLDGITSERCCDSCDELLLTIDIFTFGAISGQNNLKFQEQVQK